MDTKFEDLVEAILDGEEDDGVEAVKVLMEEGMKSVDIFSQCIEPTLNDLGEQFAKLEIFLPDLILAGDVVKAIQEYLLPLMKDEDSSGNCHGKGLIATVYGDMHDIGKNMVALMLQINGFDAIDMGVDVSPMVILKKAEEINADFVGLSGLMMPSLPYMAETIELIHASSKLKGHTKVMVGGGPVTQQWAETHGADGYSDDAMGAVQLARKLVQH
ncbi:MAG: cobalamin-dependent protein [Eubacteriales bacterium]